MILEEFNLTKGELYAIINALEETIDHEIIIEDNRFREYLEDNGIIEVVDKIYCYKSINFEEWRKNFD